MSGLKLTSFFNSVFNQYEAWVLTAEWSDLNMFQGDDAVLVLPKMEDVVKTLAAYKQENLVVKPDQNRVSNANF
jgi:hypothetical protein